MLTNEGNRSSTNANDPRKSSSPYLNPQVTKQLASAYLPKPAESFNSRKQSQESLKKQRDAKAVLNKIKSQPQVGGTFEEDFEAYSDVARNMI